MRQWVTQTLQETEYTPEISGRTYFTDQQNKSEQVPKWKYIWQQIKAKQPVTEYAETLTER